MANKMTLAQYIMNFMPADNPARISLLTSKVRELSQDSAYKKIGLESKYEIAEIMLKAQKNVSKKELLRQRIVDTLQRSATGHTARELSTMFNAQMQTVKSIIVHHNRTKTPKIIYTKGTNPIVYNICQQS